MKSELLSLLSVLAAILTALIAYIIYRRRKADIKRDAAKIIIQEIRRAEGIIADYKQTGAYQFAKKIIATNSWIKNIHLFVDDLSNDELDKISNLYSTGEYLDSLIKDISKITLEDEIERDKKRLTVELQYSQQHSLQLDGSTYPIAQFGQPPQIMVPGIRPVWKARLDIISLSLEPIYHSAIIEKLKKIAELE